MSWIPPSDPDAPPFEAWLSHRPEMLALYKRFYGTFWDDSPLPRRLVELCRLRIAQLHDCAAELALRDPGSILPAAIESGLANWEHLDGLTDAERAALRIAERMPWAHHSLEDADFAALRAFLSERETVALTVALALFDAMCRLRLVFEMNATAAAKVPAGVTVPLQ
jgi:alkylhydroperoxidase family enzyme